MYRIREHLVYVCLFATLLLSSADAASIDAALLGTINHLLTYVEESNCVFIRNGKEYTAQIGSRVSYSITARLCMTMRFQSN